MKQPEEKGLRYRTARISYIYNYALIILLIVLVAVLLPYLYQESWWSILVILGIFSIILILLFEPETERFLREYIITNTEVTKIEGILTKKRMSIPYQSVADVRITKGVTGRILNFGDVVVKGIKEDIVIKGVREPDVIQKIIGNKIARMKGVGKQENRREV